MRDEPRFQNAREIKDLDRSEATDIANAVDSPYTVLEDKQSGTCYLVYDADRADSEVSADAK